MIFETSTLADRLASARGDVESALSALVWAQSNPEAFGDMVERLRAEVVRQWARLAILLDEQWLSGEIERGGWVAHEPESAMLALQRVDASGTTWGIRLTFDRWGGLDTASLVRSTRLVDIDRTWLHSEEPRKAERVVRWLRGQV